MLICTARRTLVLQLKMKQPTVAWVCDLSLSLNVDLHGLCDKHISYLKLLFVCFSCSLNGGLILGPWCCWSTGGDSGCKTDAAAGLFSARAHVHRPSAISLQREGKQRNDRGNDVNDVLAAALANECLKCLGPVGITGVQTSVYFKELPTFDAYITIVTM
ncbi:uncharacterized protein LOC108600711 [Drosophila busckii]|uniref:uncharacterized protein LOC108600711 n=1 Tax=Drosophila busckii TaxID=30019 RepID=UPI0014328401|nr:uncharacterized protein LOC108600711 [Drosophila busckii]